jgi:hypothetical protein
LKEELERIKMVGLPSEERNRGGRYLRSTPAAWIRRRLGHTRMVVAARHCRVLEAAARKAGS